MQQQLSQITKNEERKLKNVQKKILFYDGNYETSTARFRVCLS